MPASKRQDLQGIRGIAIISVLLFHFFPEYFPNGYLGVDQFFVLSGFLMCMLLTKIENEHLFSFLKNFYFRRFKRILPLYLLVIMITVIALYNVYPSTSVLQNQSSANKALLFLSNRPQTGDEDYYKKLSVAIDLFTHTWSLSVEIQFYFLVPFVFLVGNMFEDSMKFGYYLIMGIFSYSFHCISPPEVSFNSVFARVWQFLIGMIVYLKTIEKSKYSRIPYKVLNSAKNGDIIKLQSEGNDKLQDTEETDDIVQVNSFNSLSKVLLMISIILIAACPFVIPSSISRVIFTISTGLLMLMSVDNVHLSNRFLTYIGDISYSLYLVHWPIYAFTKLTFRENYYALIGGFLISVTVAILISETFEKWYINISDAFVGFLVLVLFVTNILLINKDLARDQLFIKQISSEYKSDGVNDNMTIGNSNTVHTSSIIRKSDDAEQMNNLWNKYDLSIMLEPGCIKRTPKHNRWCDFEGNNGTFKIALFGNSYTLNHHKMVVQECRNKSYNISMYSEKGCEPLAADPEDPNCVKKLDEYVEYMESAKPDFAFMFTRFFVINSPFSNNDTDLERDSTYLEMRNQLEKFLPFIKKKLFILDLIPRVVAANVENITKHLKEGKTIQEISKTLIEADGYERGRLRHAALVKECGEKCELIDYFPLFWNKSTEMVQYFDNRGFSYFNSFYHLSPHGIEFVRPVYKKICAKL